MIDRRFHGLMRAAVIPPYTQGYADQVPFLIGVASEFGELLRLTVNVRKSAVERPWERKFLGFTVTRNGTRLKVADLAIWRLRVRVRESSIDGVQGAALLVWAAQELGDPSLRDMAVRHVRRHIEFCIREDGSVCQSASFEPQTGHLIRRYTHKGVRDDSTWTRAQAWAMVGYAVMYMWTREREFLDVATRTADWWLAHAPADRVAFWDFDAPMGPDTPRDTSGTAIAAAALLKLAALAPEETQRARYQAVAEAMVTALVERYLNARGILSHGCYNQRINLAIQHELIWGSYYLFEALHVLSGALPPAWI